MTATSSSSTRCFILLLLGRHILADPAGAFTTTHHAFVVPSVARSRPSRPFVPDTDTPRSPLPAELSSSTPLASVQESDSVEFSREATEPLPQQPQYQQHVEDDDDSFTEEQEKIEKVATEVMPLSYYDFQELNYPGEPQQRQLASRPIAIAVSVIFAAASFGLLLPVSSMLVQLLDRFLVDAVHLHWDSKTVRPLLQMLLSATEGPLAKLAVNAVLWIEGVSLLLLRGKKQQHR